MTVTHVVEGAGAPNTAPPSKSAHYLNTANGDEYRAKGTASVEDWVLQLSAPKAAELYQAKEPGKGLSSNDYTNEDKAKLAGLGSGGGLTAGPEAPQPLRVAAIGRRSTVYAATMDRTIPADVLPGDLLVMATTVWNGNALAAPAGWTLAGESIDPALTAGCRLYTRVAQAGDAGSVVTWTDTVVGAASNDLALQLIVFRGAGTPAVVNSATVAADTANTNALPAAAVTATAPLQIALAAIGSGLFSETLVGPAGWTQVSPIAQADSDGYANSFLAIAYKRLADGEATTGAGFANPDFNGTSSCASVTLLIGPSAA